MENSISHIGANFASRFQPGRESRSFRRRPQLRPGLVRTTLSVEAALSNAKTLNGTIAHDMGFHDFLYISEGDVTVPDCIGINHHIGSMFALVEAAGLIRPDGRPQSTECDPGLEGAMQFALSRGIATAAGMAFWPLIGANENVSLEFRHRVSYETPGQPAGGRDQKPGRKEKRAAGSGPVSRAFELERRFNLETPGFQKRLRDVLRVLIFSRPFA